MKVRNIILGALIACCITMSCRGPEGPAGPTGAQGGGGIESLTDPSIQPRVMYTYPPPNSVGPYDFVTSQLYVRFNKIMDQSTMRRAVTLSSPGTTVRIDTNSIFSIGGDLFYIYPAGTYYPYRWRVSET